MNAPPRMVKMVIHGVIFFKRLLTDLVSVDFSVLLSRFSTSFCGGCISLRILPPQKESKRGHNNPKTRRNTNPLTVSKLLSFLGEAFRSFVLLRKFPFPHFFWG